MKLSQDADGNYNELNIEMEQLFVAYSLQVSETSTVPQDEIQNYVVGLWFQNNSGNGLIPYQPKPCTELSALTSEGYT